ncbi:MAG: sn-glycerol-3-phosphate ABC transporter permease UgpE [Alphaproteobacteria bacterium]
MASVADTAAARRPRSLKAKARRRDILSYTILALGVLVVLFPLYITFVISTHDVKVVSQAPLPVLPGGHLFENYAAVLGDGIEAVGGLPAGRMLLVSAVMALGIAIGKIAISILSAFAIVYFRFPGRMVCFWLIFITLMLPVEVRIAPTYAVVSDLGMLNSWGGLVIPLIASATATFLFRQFFMTIPGELVEAARIDGSGPLKFFWDILLPLSRTNIAALFVILFIYGWNQYLWPLLIASDESMYPIVISIKRMLDVGDAETPWPLVTAVAILAMLPPMLIILAMQRLFIKGLVETEK